jgi:hypothetical protein
MSETPPQLPVDAMRQAAEDAAAHAEIDALHEELSKETPSADKIATHVERIRRQPKLLAIIENWFDDPRTQTFLADLSSAGL